MRICQQPHIIPSNQDLFRVILNQQDLPKYLTKAKSHDEIRIVYFGTPEFSAYVLEKLMEFCNSHFNESFTIHNMQRSLQKVYSIQAVVTNPDKAVGRKYPVIQSPVAMVANKYHLPLLKAVSLDEEFITAHLPLLTADLFIVVSFGQMLPKSLLEIPTLGTLNIHGSILPKYRGASPIQQAILNGDQETGVTIILLDQELDHGPIFAMKKISMNKQDNFETLSNKLAQLGAKLLIEFLPKFVDGKIQPVSQDHTKATYCERLTRASGYFDINNPPSSDQLDRMIRAYHPWPGVWTRWRGKIVKLHPRGVIQMEGKKAIPLKDFLNGYPDFPAGNLHLI